MLCLALGLAYGELFEPLPHGIFCKTRSAPCLTLIQTHLPLGYWCGPLPLFMSAEYSSATLVLGLRTLGRRRDPPPNLILQPNKWLIEDST
jgi:hypothetical protein